MENFDRAFAIVVGCEGGYINDPDDAGGETKFGITKRSYPGLNIKSLTVDQAKNLYLRDYWTPIHGDKMPWPLCCYAFDSAVNQGVSASIHMTQQAVGAKADGAIGPKTLAAYAASTAAHAASLMALREARYRNTRGFNKFGKGWLNRLARVIREACA